MPAANVLITGANRGVGLALVKAYLSRPSHTVIASVRNPATASDAFESLPRASGTSLIIVTIDSADFDSPARAVELLKCEHGITRLDTVIANAGATVFPPGNTSTSNLKDMQTILTINTLGPLALFQATRPLLEAAGDRKGKFVAVSSKLAIIGTPPLFYPWRYDASDPGNSYVPIEYATSKTALNKIIRHIHHENHDVISFVIHPGFVQTEMGQKAADLLGEGSPHITPEQSAKGIMSVVENATRESTSGHFMVWDGSEFPW